MSHTTQVTIMLSDLTNLDIVLGTRELAEFMGVDVGNVLTLTGEEAANMLNNIKFKRHFTPVYRRLIQSLFEVEDFHEEVLTSPIAYFDNTVKSYEGLQVVIRHND